jgi:hypothetical protein
MTTTAFTQTETTTTTATRTRRTPTWRYGLTTAVVAAAATSVVAATIRAAGVELGVGGEPIPVLAFAQMVLISAVIGIVLARHVSRTTFVRVTVALTALSCVPSIAWGATAADKVGLVCTHLVAAAIIIPRYARR